MALFKYSYATQRLAENKFRIIHNKKQILKYPLQNFPHWKYPELETKIQIGKPLMSGNLGKTRILTNYDDLYGYGLMISKRRPQVSRFFGQKIEYFLTNRTNLKPEVEDIPSGHYIEVDLITRSFRLVGKNSDNNWLSIRTKRAGQYYERRSSFDTTSIKSVQDTIQKYTPQIEEDEPEYSEHIPEIVIGITEDGKIVCIQEERENPTIGIVGKKRHGKSICKHRLMDCLYHKWKKKCIELNDTTLETDSYCLSWVPIKIFSNIELLNEVSLPLPMVYLHPKTRTLKELIGAGETGYEIYLSYFEFIQNFNNLLKGKEEWQFKNSGIYFRNLLYDSNGNIAKDSLAHCKTHIERERLVYDKLLSKEDPETGRQKKTPENVIARILNVLKDIDNSKILDTSNNTKAKWTVEFPDGHKESHYPWTACLIADLVPSIVTYDIKNLHPDYHAQYANFILNDLFVNQNGNEYFRKNKIELFLFFDEILSLVNSPTAVETFETVVRESGHARIGFTYCTQFWDKIPEFIRSQTDYVISFNQKKNQAKEICEDFDALRHRQKDLINLKKGDFIIFSNNPIVLYDEYGKREEVEGEAIKATVFPSLSSHKTPKQVGV